MAPDRDLTESDLEAFLEGSADLRGLQILHVAFALGIFLFAVLILALFSSGVLEGPRGPGGGKDASFLSILSLVHALLACASWALAFPLFRAGLARGGFRAPARDPAGDSVSPGAAGTPGETVAVFVQRLRGASLLRLAILEGPALFGLVICLVAASEGVLGDAPVYWLNSLSALLFLLFAGIAFPSRSRILALFRNQQGI